MHIWVGEAHLFLVQVSSSGLPSHQVPQITQTRVGLVEIQPSADPLQESKREQPFQAITLHAAGCL